MRYRSILIFIVSLMLFNVSKAAANQPQKWYWAWRESTKELLAYTADGQINKILEGVPVNNIWRGEDNTAIAIVTDDKQYSFYKLTPNKAIPIKVNFETQRKHNHSYGLDTLYEIRFAVDWQWSAYFVIASSDEPRKIFINLDTLQAEPINHQWSYDFVLSQDRSKLRFLVQATDDENRTILEVWERRLNDGSEKRIYRQNNSLPDTKYSGLSCIPNTYGDKWLCNLEADLKKEKHYITFLINQDGSTTQIDDDKVDHDGNFSFRWAISFSENKLIFIDRLCTGNCFIKVYSPETDTSELFPIASQYLPLAEKLWVNGAVAVNNGILVFGGGDIFRLNNDGSLRDLGKPFCCEAVATRSPDNKWYVLWSADYKKALVWNLDKDRLEFEYPIIGDMVTAVDYFERGFAITELYSPQSYVYLYSIQKPIRIMGDVAGFVIDILPDDTFLIDDSFNGDGHDEGIYRYDPTTQKYKLLVADAHANTGK